MTLIERNIPLKASYHRLRPSPIILIIGHCVRAAKYTSCWRRARYSAHKSFIVHVKSGPVSNVSVRKCMGLCDLVFHFYGKHKTEYLRYSCISRDRAIDCVACSLSGSFENGNKKTLALIRRWKSLGGFIGCSCSQNHRDGQIGWRFGVRR